MPRFHYSASLRIFWWREIVPWLPSSTLFRINIVSPFFTYFSLSREASHFHYIYLTKNKVNTITNVPRRIMYCNVRGSDFQIMYCSKKFQREVLSFMIYSYKNKFLWRKKSSGQWNIQSNLYYEIKWDNWCHHANRRVHVNIFHINFDEWIWEFGNLAYNCHYLSILTYIMAINSRINRKEHLIVDNNKNWQI